MLVLLLSALSFLFLCLPSIGHAADGPVLDTEGAIAELKAAMGLWAENVTVLDLGEPQAGNRIVLAYGRVETSDQNELAERCRDAERVIRESFPPEHEVEVRISGPRRSKYYVCDPVITAAVVSKLPSHASSQSRRKHR